MDSIILQPNANNLDIYKYLHQAQPATTTLTPRGSSGAVVNDYQEANTTFYNDHGQKQQQHNPDELLTEYSQFKMELRFGNREEQSSTQNNEKQNSNRKVKLPDKTSFATGGLTDFGGANFWKIKQSNKSSTQLDQDALQPLLSVNGLKTLVNKVQETSLYNMPQWEPNALQQVNQEMQEREEQSMIKRNVLFMKHNNNSQKPQVSHKSLPSTVIHHQTAHNFHGAVHGLSLKTRENIIHNKNKMVDQETMLHVKSLERTPSLLVLKKWGVHTGQSPRVSQDFKETILQSQNSEYKFNPITNDSISHKKSLQKGSVTKSNFYQHLQKHAPATELSKASNDYKTLLPSSHRTITSDDLSPPKQSNEIRVPSLDLKPTIQFVSQDSTLISKNSTNKMLEQQNAIINQLIKNFASQQSKKQFITKPNKQQPPQNFISMIKSAVALQKSLENSQPHSPRSQSQITFMQPSDKSLVPTNNNNSTTRRKLLAKYKKINSPLLQQDTLRATTGFNTERELENKSPQPIQSVKVRFTEEINTTKSPKQYFAQPPNKQLSTLQNALEVKERNIYMRYQGRIKQYNGVNNQNANNSAGGGTNSDKNEQFQEQIIKNLSEVTAQNFHDKKLRLQNIIPAETQAKLGLVQPQSQRQLSQQRSQDTYTTDFNFSQDMQASMIPYYDDKKEWKLLQPGKQLDAQYIHDVDNQNNQIKLQLKGAGVISLRNQYSSPNLQEINIKNAQGVMIKRRTKDVILMRISQYNHQSPIMLRRAQSKQGKTRWNNQGHESGESPIVQTQYDNKRSQNKSQVDLFTDYLENKEYITTYAQPLNFLQPVRGTSIMGMQQKYQ